VRALEDRKDAASTARPRRQRLYRDTEDRQRDGLRDRVMGDRLACCRRHAVAEDRRGIGHPYQMIWASRAESETCRSDDCMSTLGGWLVGRCAQVGVVSTDGRERWKSRARRARTGSAEQAMACSATPKPSKTVRAAPWKVRRRRSRGGESQDAQSKDRRRATRGKRPRRLPKPHSPHLLPTTLSSPSSVASKLARIPITSSSLIHQLLHAQRIAAVPLPAWRALDPSKPCLLG
jgi:hypothetical protein